MTIHLCQSITFALNIGVMVIVVGNGHGDTDETGRD